MRIVDENLLERVRLGGQCCWCRRRTTQKLDPAHIIATGMGGGRRLDHPWNVVGLCRECHNQHHAGHRPLPCDLFLMVAHREGMLQEDIERELYRILQLPRSIGHTTMPPFLPSRTATDRVAKFWFTT